MSLYDDDDFSTPSSHIIPLTLPTSSGINQHYGEPPKAKKARLQETVEENKLTEERFPVKEHALLAVVVGKKGERDEMQDRHLLLSEYCLNKPFIKRSCLFAIFDGHSGVRAAKHCQEKLPSFLMKKLCAFSDLCLLEKGLKASFTQCYKELDAEFLAEARKEKPIWKDGTTATTVLIINDIIFVANIGDSKAIVARFKEETKPTSVVLTIDHNPTLYAERIRIQETGANVINGRINGNLEVSRAIGDGPFKTYGVICSPDVKKCIITEHDRFLIVASDGLWKVFTVEEAVNFVNQEIHSPPDDSWIGTQSEITEFLWQRAVNRLSTQAVLRHSGDNVSIILVCLKKLPS